MNTLYSESQPSITPADETFARIQKIRAEFGDLEGQDLLAAREDEVTEISRLEVQAAQEGRENDFFVQEDPSAQLGFVRRSLQAAKSLLH